MAQFICDPKISKFYNTNDYIYLLYYYFPRYFRIDRSEFWRQNAKRCKPNHVGSQTSWLNLV